MVRKETKEEDRERDRAPAARSDATDAREPPLERERGDDGDGHIVVEPERLVQLSQRRGECADEHRVLAQANLRDGRGLARPI